MKFMIVTNNRPWGEAMCEMAKKLGFVDAIAVSHDHALEQFLSFEPTHVLVGEYESHKGAERSKRWSPAHRSWKDIANAAQPGQIVKRCGFIALDEPDFMRLPIGETAFKLAFLPS